MIQSFREFVNAGAFQNTGTTGYDSQFWGIGHSLSLPTPTLDMPTKTVQGTVRRIVYNENPISVQLDNGTIWHLTKQQWDYLKATNKEPKINSNIQIEMFLDGTIKGVFINHSSMGITEKKGNFGGRENNTMMGKPARGKPEKTFGKKHMPF
jgi:hypothetical protein